MPDMIESMARALLEADLRRTGDYENSNTRQIIEQGWPGWVNAAKAVQAVIRTPTDAMTRAGASVPIPPPGMPSMEASRLVWQAHVDAMETEGAGDG